MHVAAETSTRSKPATHATKSLSLIPSYVSNTPTPLQTIILTNTPDSPPPHYTTSTPPSSTAPTPPQTPSSVSPSPVPPPTPSKPTKPASPSPTASTRPPPGKTSSPGTRASTTAAPTSGPHPPHPATGATSSASAPRAVCPILLSPPAAATATATSVGPAGPATATPTSRWQPPKAAAWRRGPLPIAAFTCAPDWEPRARGWSAVRRSRLACFWRRISR